MIESSAAFGFKVTYLGAPSYNEGGWQVIKEFDQYGFLNISLIPPYGSTIDKSAKIYSHLERSLYSDGTLGFNFQGSDYKVWGISIERHSHVVGIVASKVLSSEPYKHSKRWGNKLITLAQRCWSRLHSQPLTTKWLP